MRNLDVKTEVNLDQPKYISDQDFMPKENTYGSSIMAITLDVLGPLVVT